MSKESGIILFEEDWAKYPTAIIHKTTRNKSWWRMAQVYRTMGIENHAFMLALINPHLEFVDPHSQFLTQDEKDMIVAECGINPWYFFREVARVPGQVGSPAIPFEANRGNIAAWWCIFNHITTLLTQPRQTGKSYTIYILEVLILGITSSGTLINLFTKDEKLRKEAIDIIKAMFDALPSYLDLRNKRTDANNTEEITVNLRKNKMKTFLPRASEKDANNVGRGFGAAFNHVDEGPFCTNADISIPAMFSAGNAVRDRAKDVGAPYCNILTTTSGKLDTNEGKFVYKNYVMDGFPWSETLYDRKNWEDLYEFICSNNNNNFQVAIILSHRQLGKSDQWLAEKMRETKSTGDAADRDYFNVWTSGTVRHPLIPALLKNIVNSRNEHVYPQIDVKNKYVLNWNVDKHNLENYLRHNKLMLGCDSSSASNGDDIGLVWKDVKTLDVVCSASINTTNILDFAQWLGMHLVENPNVTLIIERRSTGDAIVDILLKMLPALGVDPFKRMFNLLVQDKDEHPDRYDQLRSSLGHRDATFYTLNKSSFGFATSGSGRFARNELYGINLQNAAKRGGHRVYSSKLIDQIVGLEEKNNRVDHGNGKHDDMVIAWLLCDWFLSNGKNMSHYGITEIMTQIDEVKELTDEEQYALLVQQDIEGQIHDAARMLEDSVDPYISEKLERKIRSLGQSLVFGSNNFTNVDQMLTDIADRKKKRVQRNGILTQERQEAQNDHDYYKSLMGLNDTVNKRYW